MATLPSNRTIDAVLLMAPAVHATGPRGAYTINGSQSYENLYTLNGAVINENLRGAPMTPYIEDALQEVTVASAGVSAEYGRFAGGVANAITKSGGNTFSGSFRTSFANDKLASLTPFQIDAADCDASTRSTLKLDKIVPTYEATFGGPIATGRALVFSARRVSSSRSRQRTTVVDEHPVRPHERREAVRRQADVHASPGPFGAAARTSSMDQVLSNNTGSQRDGYREPDQPGAAAGPVSPCTTPVCVRRTSSSRRSIRRGTLTFTDVGADTTDRIHGTMILDISSERRFWSPTFCSGSRRATGTNSGTTATSCSRDRQFLSNAVVGFAPHGVRLRLLQRQHLGEHARERQRLPYPRDVTRFFADGDVYPQFIPGTAAHVDRHRVHADPGSSSEGSNLRTHSLFVNDTWRLSEPVHVWTSGCASTRTRRRMAAARMSATTCPSAPGSRRSGIPAADGRWAVSAAIARYVMALTSNLAGSTTAAGNAATLPLVLPGPGDQRRRHRRMPAARRHARPRSGRCSHWFDANGGTMRRPIAARHRARRQHDDARAAEVAVLD